MVSWAVVAARDSWHTMENQFPRETGGCRICASTRLHPKYAAIYEVKSYDSYNIGSTINCLIYFHFC